jgi:hypothetical protein
MELLTPLSKPVGSSLWHPVMPSSRLAGSSDSESQARHVLSQIFCYLLLPNAPFWIAGHYFLTIPRAIFNLDYLVVGLFSLFLSRITSVLLFTLVFLFDILANTASFYYFSQVDLVSSARYLVRIPWERTAITSLILVSLSVSLAVLVSGIAKIHSASSCRSIAALLTGLLLILVACKMFSWHRESIEDPNIATSPVRKIAMAAWYVTFPGCRHGSNHSGPLCD